MLLITIIVVLASLIILVSLHEVGHFLFAKKFGIKVEEFGVGYPPRLWGKKVGETVYSINLLPFGAFVKILGIGDEAVEDKRSFSKKPLWQRAVVLLGGIVAFWVIAALIFTFVAGMSGVPTPVPDEFSKKGVSPYVQILAVAAGSPADSAGIKAGDEITQLKVQSAKSKVKEINTVREVQEFTEEYKGESITLTLLRGAEEVEVSLVPRAFPPMGEGAMGVALVRVANLKTVWFKAPVVGAKITVSQTRAIPSVMFDALKRKLRGERVTDVQFVGPIGAGQIMGQALNRGLGNFFMFVGMISIWLALFNLVPVPALDGGRLLFLVIEGVARKPVPHKIEQKITGVFFCLLIALMVLLSIRDIIRLF